MKQKHPVFSAVLGTLKRYWLLSLLLLCSIAATALSGLLPPLILLRIVNSFADLKALVSIPEQDPAAAVLLRLGLLYFGSYALTYITEGLREILITVLGQKVIHGLRSAMLRKLRRLPANDFITGDPGAVSARMVEDVATVETLFSSGILGLVSDLFSLFGICIALITLVPGTALLLLPSLPFVVFLTLWFRKITFRSQLSHREATAVASGIIPETLRNRRAIHNTGARGFFIRRYGAALQQSFDARERTNFCDAVYSPIIVTLSGVLVGLCFFWWKPAGGRMFSMDAGTAAAMIAYIAKIFGPIQSMGMEIQSIQTASAGIRRIGDFLLAPERALPEELSAATVDTADNAEPADTAVPVISFQNVDFAYDEAHPVLHGFDLTLAPGETVTLMGRTGAGKSTVFRLLLGLYTPQKGKIRVCGTDPAAIADAEKRRIFGYVEQTFSPVPGTVLDQLTLSDARITEAMAEKALRTVGLYDLVNSLPQGWHTPMSLSLFSQGQLQLLSIARAIAAEPQILLLDEITANLDAATETAVLDALEAAGEGRTILSVSHRLYENRGKDRRVEM